MSVKTFQSMSPNAQDTGRAPSMSIWGDFPIQEIRQSMAGGYGEAGILIEDEFTLVPTPSSGTAAGTMGQWSSWFGSATLSVKDGIEEGGVAKFDSSSTDANKSITLTSNSSSFRFIGGSTGFATVGGRFAMEFRIALGSIAASQQGVFIGLADSTGGLVNASDVIIQASGGNTLTTTKNIFGFFNRTTTCPSDFSFVYQPAAGTAVYPTGLTTLVNTVTGANIVAYAASTDKGKGTGFVKIGMTVDFTVDIPAQVPPSTKPATQTAGVLYKPVMQFYVNGQIVPAFIDLTTMQSALFPVNTVFCPVINYMNIASATAPVYLDWVRFCQVASF